MAGRNPPPYLNTDEDRGAIVAVVSFTTIAVSTFTNTIRVWTRQESEAALGLDDVLLIAANITAIVQTVLVGRSVSGGLGRHYDTLSDGSIASYHKFSYASGILAIISMACTKFSVLQLQRRLCGVRPTSRYIKVMYRALAGILVIWTLFSVLAIAFQCGIASPHVYEPDKCAGGVVWYPITIVNAITDAVLAFSFSPIILKLAARRRTKVKIMGLLGMRLLVCVATLVQVASLAGSLKAGDQTRANMKFVILQQIVMNLSLLTAVVLGLHGFIANLTAGGGFGVEVRDSTNELSNASYGRSRLATGFSKASSRPNNGRREHSSHERRPRVHKMGSGFRPDKAATSSAWVQHEEADDREESDGRSHSSQENIIMQTVTWQVSRDVASSSSPSQTPHEEPGEVSARSFVV